MAEDRSIITPSWRQREPPNGHQLVLDFLGEFATTQSWVDLALEWYLKSKLPDLGPVVAAKLERIRDEDRIDIVRALAREVEYSGPLENFKRVYRRAADVRNRIAHHPVTFPMWDAGAAVDGSDDYYGVAGHGVWSRKKLKPLPIEGRFTTDTFSQLINDCAWLTDHLQRLLFEADVVPMTTFTGDPYVPSVPPHEPKGGLPM